MLTWKKALLGVLTSTAGIAGCLLSPGGDVPPDADPVADYRIGSMPPIPKPDRKTDPVVNSPRSTTYCGNSSADLFSDVELYDLPKMDKELKADSALRAASGLERIESCEDARLMIEAKMEMQQSTSGNKSRPEQPSTLVNKWRNGTVRSLAGSVGITIFASTRADDRFCSGTLVSESSLVTAAHCFGRTLGTSSGQVWVVVTYRSPRDNQYYFVSDSNVTTTGSLAAFKQAWVDIHPDYTGSGDAWDDLALVTLPDIGPRTRFPQDWSVPNGNSDFMTFASPNVVVGQSTLFHGWGITGDNLTNSGQARVPQDSAAKTVDEVSSDNKYFIVNAESDFGVCVGDSGGAAYTARGTPRLMGVPAWVNLQPGRPTNWCAQNGDAQFWTALPPKLAWIKGRIEARSGACKWDSNRDELRCF